MQRMADISALGPDILPMAAFRNLEAVVLGELGEFHVAAGIFQGNGILFVIDIGEPLEEQQRKDIGLEIDRIDRTAQNVGGLPEMRRENRDIQICLIILLLFAHCSCNLELIDF